MRFTASVPSAISLVICSLLSASSLPAAEHPHYGGTLRVEFRGAGATLDPREWKAGSVSFGADEKLAQLVFDRLVTLNNYGRFEPALATQWSHDPSFKRWQFTLRPGVRFSDGSVLTASDVATALRAVLPATHQVNVLGNFVVFQASMPIPDLLEELASGRNLIFRAQPDGTMLGTGPFIAAKSSSKETGAGKGASGELRLLHMRFVANEESWAGRPFLNEIDVTFGIPVLRQILDLQLGHADIVEISPEWVRRVSQEKLRVWASSPLTLLALRFDSEHSASSNEKLREALAFSLDRGTMAGVLLQKQAEPASALLPQWLSGYAFLFSMKTDLERAKEIRSTLPGNLATVSEPLRMCVDAAGDLAKLLGERVAVNARQAQLFLQVANRTLNRSLTNSATSSCEPAAGLHLIAWRYSSLSARAELESFVRSQIPAEAAGVAAPPADPEQDYARERKLLDDHRIVPLVALPEFVGLSANVRDWMPTKWAKWNLADVWLDAPETVTENPGTATSSSTQSKSAPSGAKP
jgi:peptide/nickel transport system substrate-binding protein